MAYTIANHSSLPELAERRGPTWPPEQKGEIETAWREITGTEIIITRKGGDPTTADNSKGGRNILREERIEGRGGKMLQP